MLGAGVSGSASRGVEAGVKEGGVRFELRTIMWEGRRRDGVF